MAENVIPFRVTAKDDASEALERVRVAVIDARGNRTEIVGEIVEFDLPDGVEWPTLPEVGDDGRSHHMEIIGRGEVRCLPDCPCQTENEDR